MKTSFYDKLSSQFQASSEGSRQSNKSSENKTSVSFHLVGLLNLGSENFHTIHQLPSPLPNCIVLSLYLYKI